ncbi:hypothetical protein LWI28_023085 [Acer negundo]|uniref:Uncharacterized protein n=1 Tax=Acer negundo TaxID=4023 RepID=A0AAD5NYJ7_ACENE|nr:hypothetical protein LWI28_023085 [Acer negundo]
MDNVFKIIVLHGTNVIDLVKCDGDHISLITLVHAMTEQFSGTLKVPSEEYSAWEEADNNGYSVGLDGDNGDDENNDYEDGVGVDGDYVDEKNNDYGDGVGVDGDNGDGVGLYGDYGDGVGLDGDYGDITKECMDYLRNMSPIQMISSLLTQTMKNPM